MSGKSARENTSEKVSLSCLFLGGQQFAKKYTKDRMCFVGRGRARDPWTESLTPRLLPFMADQ